MTSSSKPYRDAARRMVEGWEAGSIDTMPTGACRALGYRPSLTYPMRVMFRACRTNPWSREVYWMGPSCFVRPAQRENYQDRLDRRVYALLIMQELMDDPDNAELFG